MRTAVRWRRPRLALLTLLALAGQTAGYGLHFSAERHAIGSSGAVVHVDDCAAHRPSDRPPLSFTSTCDDLHDQHPCSAWASLRHRVTPGAPASAAPAHVVAYQAPTARAPQPPRRPCLDAAPKTSPPCLA